MVGVALADRESYCSIIADGHHVDDITLKVALAAKPRDRIMLITDAMSTAAGGPDSFDLQGRLVTRVDGRLELDDGTLAGSDLTMDAAVRHCVAKLGLPLEDALRSASLNPAGAKSTSAMSVPRGGITYEFTLSACGGRACCLRTDRSTRGQ